jgi:hypothetical protein
MVKLPLYRLLQMCFSIIALLLFLQDREIAGAAFLVSSAIYSLTSAVYRGAEFVAARQQDEVTDSEDAS